MEPRDVLAQLQRIPLFWDLEEEEKEAELLRLVPYVRERTYDPGQRLLTRTTPPNKTVLILKGRVQVTRRDDALETEIQEVGERGPGAILGRTSLRVGDFERLMVEALEETEVLTLPFRDLIRTYQKSEYLREHLEGPLKPDLLVDRLKTIPLFSALTDRMGELELYQVAEITHERYYEDDEWLFRQGEVSDRLILVIGGQIELTAVDQNGVLREAGTLEPGDVAGETGLLVGDFHDVTAIAAGYARVLYLLRSEFEELLQERPYLRRGLTVSEEVERRRQVRTFSWLRSDEWVVAVVQRHWSRLVQLIVAPGLVLLLLLPVMVALILRGTTFFLLLAGLLLLPMLGLALWIAWQYINWRDDYFVLTTQRVAHIERVGPFSTQLEESLLHNVEDIYEVQPGLSANLLGYGNLVLQTAGETIDIDMSFVPRPAQLRRLVYRQIERARARDVLKTRGQIRDLLAHRLEIRELPELEPDTGLASPREGERYRVRPSILFTSVWEFFFPPSRIEADEGNTIIWRRFWLPGLFHYAPAMVALLVTTIGGVAYLATRWGQPTFASWLVGWLFIEAVLTGVLLWLVEDWRNDFFQLTPSHIILVQRRPLLLRESRRQARLDRIQNLAYEIPTIVARALDYGHVHFETAGTTGQFQLRYVHHPERVQATISNRQYEYRQNQSEFERQRRQQELLTWFSAYDELHQETST